MALPPGLVNLGSSCFINASLQALVAVPALRAALGRGTSHLEMALQEVVRRLGAAGGAVTPTELTDLFYRHRQEAQLSSQSFC
eukprot:s1371_g10.t1